MKTDVEIKQDLLIQIKSRLEFEPGVNADDLNISVMNGIVTLAGSVPNYADKVAILDAVKNEAGVFAWCDEIVVALPESHRRSDVELVAAAREAISIITTVPIDLIRITARNGWLTLAGKVEHLCQKEAAEYAVICLTGLAGVVNSILVEAQRLQPNGREFNETVMAG